MNCRIFAVFIIHCIPYTECGGSLAVIVNDVIFSGDTLLKNGHGKTTLPGGNEEKLIASIRRMLEELKRNYRILTGHREETTLDEAREYWNTTLTHEKDAS